MKKLTLIWIMALFALQSDAQQLQKPAAGKCIVYFTRVTSMGVAINFKYFDGEKYLGKFNGRKYMIYECDPGRHLFWARSENNDYVEAEQIGRAYV